jgi:hypothetical protein
MKPIRLTLNQAIYFVLLPLPLILSVVLLRNIYVSLPVRLFLLAFLLGQFIFILKMQFSIIIQVPQHVLLHRKLFRVLCVVGIVLFSFICLFPFLIKGYGDIGYFLVCTSFLTFLLSAKMLSSTEALDD